MKKEVKPDVVELINKMREQIAVIDRKIDALISKTSPRAPEVKPFQPPAHANNQNVRRQDNGFRERVLHKAVCADCRKECEVPFKPTGERPVYCKECFSKRKSGNSFKMRPDSGPRLSAPVHPAHIDKPEAAEKKKPAAKKKKAVSKKKK